MLFECVIIKNNPNDLFQNSASFVKQIYITELKQNVPTAESFMQPTMSSSCTPLPN